MQNLMMSLLLLVPMATGINRTVAIAESATAPTSRPPAMVAVDPPVLLPSTPAQPITVPIVLPPQCRKVAYAAGLKMYYEHSNSSIVLTALPAGSFVSLVTQQGTNQPFVFTDDKATWVQVYLEGFNRFGQQFVAVGWVQNNSVPPRRKSNLVNCQ
jgi:hypothetical protein